LATSVVQKRPHRAAFKLPAAKGESSAVLKCDFVRQSNGRHRRSAASSGLKSTYTRPLNGEFEINGPAFAISFLTF